MILDNNDGNHLIKNIGGNHLIMVLDNNGYMTHEEFVFRLDKTECYSEERKVFEEKLKQTTDHFSELDPQNVNNPCKLAVPAPPVKCIKRAVFDVLETQDNATQLAAEMLVYFKHEIYLNPSMKEDIVMKFRFLERHYGESWGDTGKSGVECLRGRLLKEMKFFINERLNSNFPGRLSRQMPKLDRRISSYVYDPFKFSICLCYTGTDMNNSFLHIQDFYNSRQMPELLIFVFWSSFFNKLADDIPSY